jgi:hypothetical protein
MSAETSDAATASARVLVELNSQPNKATRRVDRASAVVRSASKMAKMAARIVRVWKGYGTAEGVQRYCDDHFTLTVLPQLRALEGFLDASVLVRSLANETEVVVATVWDSFDSVKRFAGEDYQQAVVEPIVRDLLDRFDDRVTHFTVAVAT